MGNDRKQEDRIQELTEGKACLKSQVFKRLLKTPSEGARRISDEGRSIVEGPLPRRPGFLFFLSGPLSALGPSTVPPGCAKVIRVDLGGRRRSAKFTMVVDIIKQQYLKPRRMCIKSQLTSLKGNIKAKKSTYTNIF